MNSANKSCNITAHTSVIYVQAWSVLILVTMKIMLKDCLIDNTIQHFVLGLFSYFIKEYIIWRPAADSSPSKNTLYHCEYPGLSPRDHMKTLYKRKAQEWWSGAVLALFSLCLSHCLCGCDPVGATESCIWKALVAKEGKKE